MEPWHVERSHFFSEHRESRVRHSRRPGAERLPRGPRAIARIQIRRRSHESSDSTDARPIARACHWIDIQLGDGRPWLLGKQPGLGDVNAYMNIWYVRSNLPDSTKLFERFPKMLLWEERMKGIGHGTRERELSSAEALEIARKSTPQTPAAGDDGDPNGRKPGDHVTVTPDDYGKIPVEGTIVSLSAQHIA